MASSSSILVLLWFSLLEGDVSKKDLFFPQNWAGLALESFWIELLFGLAP